MQIIDLSLNIEEGMMTFPVSWHPNVEISQLGRFHVEGRETRKITIGTHSGTHVDAPRHFIKNGTTVDMIDLLSFYGPCILLDFHDLPDKAEISKDMLFKRLNGREPRRILFRYDWSERMDSLDYYSKHPFLLEEACHYLVEIGVKLVGFDAPMPDNPENGKGSIKDSPNHSILLGSNIVILEYLTNLKALENKSFILAAFPMKIVGGDGSPVRAVAILGENNER